MLQKLFYRTIPGDFSVKLKFLNILLSRIFDRTYLGHGVTFEIKSSTPNDIPLINKVEPNPFHNVVMP